MSSLLLQRARIATAVIFFVNGALSANWLARVPTIKQTLSLSTGQLGLVLFGMPIGLLIGAVLTPWLVKKFGDRDVVRGAALIYCAALPLLGIHNAALGLFLLFLLMGAAAGTLDVAMNIQASEVEKRYHKPIMSSFHALFSAGGLLGALLAGLLITIGLSVTQHLLLAGIGASVLTLLSYRWFIKDVEAEDAPLFVRPNRSLITLGIIALCVMMGEGAIGDWSGVYLRETVGSGFATATLGYAAFSLTMALGRFAGDSLIARFGGMRVTFLGGICAFLGMLLVVLVPREIAVIAGFGAVGLGFAAIFPIIVSAAGRNTTMPPSFAIASVTTIGYFGFLAGPPVIGLVAEFTSLQVSLGIIAILSLVIVLFSRATK